MSHLYALYIIIMCMISITGIGKLLSDTGKELTVKFDRTCSFRKVFDSIVDDVNQMARKCGELDQRARQLCNDLHINTQEFTG